MSTEAYVVLVGFTAWVGMAWALSVILSKLNQLEHIGDRYDRWLKNRDELIEELRNEVEANNQVIAALGGDVELYKSASLQYERLAGERAAIIEKMQRQERDIKLELRRARAIASIQKAAE
jgi:hypothetical protein